MVKKLQKKKAATAPSKSDSQKHEQQFKFLKEY